MIKYNKTQYGLFPNLIILSVLLFVLYSFYNQTGNNPIPFLPTVIITLLFVFILLLFYKLTVTIDAEKITASFGIGLIKKSILIKDIDQSSIEKVKIPWYYGIGLRATPKGWLYNIRIGNAIYFKAKNNYFLVGTPDYDSIKTILVNEK